MAATGNFTLTGNISNLPSGAATLGPLSITTAAAVQYEATVALNSGANTVTLPSAVTVLVLIGPNGVSPQPNPTSAAVLTLKGVAGDTGLVISSRYPTVISYDAGQSPANIVINATVGSSVYLWAM